MGFEQAAEDNGVGAVAQSFDNRNDPMGAHMGFEHADVVHKRTGIHGQGGDVAGRGQRLNDGTHGVVGGRFQQHVGVVQVTGQGRQLVGFSHMHHGDTGSFGLGMERAHHGFCGGVGPCGSPNPHVRHVQRSHKCAHALGALGLGQPTLRDVADNGDPSVGPNASRQRPQRHFQRPKVVVAVVRDQYTATGTVGVREATAQGLKPFQSAGHWLKLAPVVQGDQGGGAGVAKRRGVVERKGCGSGASFPDQIHLRWPLGHVHNERRVCFFSIPFEGPGHDRAAEVRFASAFQKRRHEHPCAALKQRALFLREVVGVLKIPEMRLSQMGQHAFGGGHARFQTGHVAWMAQSCLDQGDVVVGVEGPHAQRNAELAVVAEGAAMDGNPLGEEGSDPFFDGGFSVAPRHPQHGPLERVTLGARHGLHGLQHVGDHEHIG